MMEWKICVSRIFFLILHSDMEKTVATIGFFDGVHRGHQCLIEQVREAARIRAARSMVVTMRIHPKVIVQPGCEPRLLTLPEEKERLLRATGVDAVEVLRFDKRMSGLAAPLFMRKVLSEQLRVTTLVMGYEHKFGHGGGTPEQYFGWGKECGIEVLRAHKMEDEHVSSSVIRRLLEDGNVETANRLLGYFYELTGIVVEGRHVGRTLGFPTANLQFSPEKLLPAGGVYATWVVLPNGLRRPGMLNIGCRPTLDNGADITTEVHVMDYSGNLYQKSICLELVGRLRGERRFASLGDLQNQLLLDSEAVRKQLLVQ